MTQHSPFDRFVAAVHRRAVATSIVERIGICLAIAAGAACLLALAAGWRGVDVWPIVIAIAVVAVAVGAAWGVLRRPSRLTAVLQADQQLKLADLLSSALTASDDDFGRVVRALAERTCGQHSPSEVMLARYGARVWGGIGLAWAMVIVIGLLAGNGSTSQADSRTTNLQNVTGAAPGQLTTASRDTHSPGGKEATSENTSHFGGPTDPQNTTANTAAQGKPTSPTAAGGQESATTGHASVDPTRTALPPNANASASSDTTTAGGDGTSSQANVKPGQPAVGTVAARPGDRSAAPWSSDRWPADRDAALHAVEAGQVPDAYRDLVRDYFTPTAAK